MDILIEGSLEVKLPTIWPDERQRWEESEKRREGKRREDKEGKRRKGKSREGKRREDKIKETKFRRKKIQVREKVGKSRFTVVFPMTCGFGGSAKAAGAEPCGHMRDEKLHAVVARSTFPSQNVQNTSCLDDFWKLRCRKSARRCGAKHISSQNVSKHFMFRALLEVEMFKKCTRLWREAHVQVKMYKTHHFQSTFGS